MTVKLSDAALAIGFVAQLSTDDQLRVYRSLEQQLRGEGALPQIKEPASRRCRLPNPGGFRVVVDNGDPAV